MACAFHKSSPGLVINDEGCDRVVLQLFSLEPAGISDCFDIHTAISAKFSRFLNRLSKQLNEFELILNWQLALLGSTFGGPIDRQGFLKVAKNSDVINNQPVLLFSPDAICPSDGLHQRVVLHRLVEVDGGTRRHIETRNPHSAHEHNSERIV